MPCTHPKSALKNQRRKFFSNDGINPTRKVCKYDIDSLASRSASFCSSLTPGGGGTKVTLLVQLAQLDAAMPDSTTLTASLSTPTLDARLARPYEITRNMVKSVQITMIVTTTRSVRVSSLSPSRGCHGHE
jgi:hypothetical protein